MKQTWTGLIWFEPVTATKIDAITKRQMPSGKFHCCLCAKLDADAMCQIQMMGSSIITAKILFVLWTNTNMWYLAIKLTVPGVESPII